MLEKISQVIQAVNADLKEILPKITSLSKFRIPLDADPLSKGLISFNQKLADIQASKDIICSLINSLLLHKNTLENARIQLDKHIDTRKAELLESNAEYYLKTLKTQEQRDDVMNKVLKDETALATMLSRLISTVKCYYESSKNQLNNLESTNNNLKKQLDVIDDMISIGELNKGGYQQ